MTVRIGRRKFLGVVGFATVTWPVNAGRGKGQAARRLVVGSESKVAKSFADDLLDGMRGLGYVDGRDFGFVPPTAP